MTQVWQSGDVSLYQDDCLDVLPALPPASIDLTVTSPPYDDLRVYDGFSFDFERTALELYRVTKPTGVVVWIVGDQTINGSETGTSFKQALYFKEIGFNLHDTMIYQKNGPAFPSRNRYYHVFEFMFVFTKSNAFTFNPIKDRVNRWHGEKFSKVRTRRDRAGNLNRMTWDKEEGERLGVRFNVWKYNVGAGNSYEEDYASEHPAIFPEALARDHILSWSNPGDTVLDPLMGSGTTGKMAILTQRKFIGIECSPKYFDLSIRRIKQAQLQLPLPL